MKSKATPPEKSPELVLAVMPDGALNLEYAEGELPPGRRERDLQETILARWSSDPDDALLFMGFSHDGATLSPSLEYLRRFAGEFARRLRRMPELETIRHKAVIPLEEDVLPVFLDRIPPMTGAEYLNADVLGSVWKRMNRAFARAIQNWKGPAEAWIQSYNPDVHLAGRVYFHLVENKDNDLPFAFLATYSNRLDEKGKTRHLPLQHALREYGENSKALLDMLVAVHRAARRSRLIAGLIESGEIFHPLGWTAGEAFTFLKEVPFYEEAGVLCRIPNWWKPGGAGPRMTIAVGDRQPSLLGMDAILSFKPRLMLGDTEITPEEVRALLSETEGLAFIKNRWVAADPEKIRRTLEAYEQAKSLVAEGLTLREAMRLQLNPQTFALDDLEQDVNIAHGRWLASVMQKLANPEQIPEIRSVGGLTAKLRPYQRQGVNWLWFLHSLGFGACLADDMGLGKTVQLLGFLCALQSHHKTAAKKDRKASLLIVPASLLANWTGEIERFAPDLKYLVCHPSFRRADNGRENVPPNPDAWDLVITTYALTQRYETLQTHAWRYVILDEAQVIKNPGTKQTRAVKKLFADNRIVMTGTPVENRLSDLWSLFDFLNPGLLGNAKEFGALTKNIHERPGGYARLRKVVSPYLLRRLKTDKSVIRDLPDKVEMKTYADLSKKQVLLYGRLVEDVRRSIEETEDIRRRGVILASLMKFKQICNHPDQFLGAESFDEPHSGKFERLREICETIYAKRERVLVFTQFREMTEPLAEFLAGVFQREGLILHGGVPVGKRKTIVEAFQGHAYVPFMVLSLKAGGVGLNLTAAGHVVHFDRWWNPAVENQATDRAFRIGQQKNVMVHKFLTRGTVEEKIDRMLEEKTALSSRIVAATGEQWITEMKTDALMELFKLSL